MEKLLRDLPYFVEVGKHKSFSRAAEVLDVPISTLSRRISAFEKELGVTLLRRSTRNVDLTESGKVFYEQCSYVLAEAEMARENLIRNLTSPTGVVRVAVPSDFFHVYLRGVFGAFAAKYPGIEMQVHFTTRWVDFLTEPYDLDFRGGPLPDSSLKVRKLLSLRPVLVAAHKLFEKYPPIKSIADLEKTPCIGFRDTQSYWPLYKDGKEERAKVKIAHTVNSLSLAFEFALAGLGVTWLGGTLLEHPEFSKVLTQVLPGYTGPEVSLSVVMAPGQMPQRVRLLLDHLIDHFDQVAKGKVTMW